MYRKAYLNVGYCRYRGMKQERNQNMNYPAEYKTLAENEMTYIAGGADYVGLFNYLIGDYLRDMLLGEVRSTVWNAASNTSINPIVDWVKGFMSKNIVMQLGYIYGAVRLGEQVDTYISGK